MSGPLSSLKGEIHTDDATRAAFSRDASIFEVLPQGVIAPKDASDIKTLVQMATKLAVQGRPISFTARTGGTDMSGGPLNIGWILDMQTHFSAIGDVDEYHKRVTVQGGVMHRAIEAATHPKSLYFAPYTSSHDICGIGGMIGNNASGEKSLQHGPTSANIDRLKVVLSDGNEYDFGPLNEKQLAVKLAQPDYEGDIYRAMTALVEENKHLITTHHPRVPKNAAGYALWGLWNDDHTEFNLARLFIGSQGTLGITTEAELKLVTTPKYTRMIVTAVSDLADIVPVVTTLLEHKPASCETFDSHTYELAKKYYANDAERAKIADGKAFVVLSVFESDSRKALDKRTDAAWASLAQQGYDTYGINEQAVIDSFLLIRRKSTALLQQHQPAGTIAAAFLEDAIVPIEHYGEFLGHLTTLLSDYDMTYTYAGHIGAGSLRLIPLVDTTKPHMPDTIMELEEKVNALVLKYHGSISADHNDGLIRTPFLEAEYGAHMVRLFEQVKNLFDPFDIFNPGKKVYGSKDFALTHIIRG